MARAISTLAVAMVTLWAAWLLSGCGGGGGGGGTPPPPPPNNGGTTPSPSTAYITLTGGRVVVEQGSEEVIIKAGEGQNGSQLPGVGFDRDEVEVRIYKGDIFEPPRASVYPPPRQDPFKIVHVDREGRLKRDLTLGKGRYTAVAENIRVVQDGKEFRSALVAYVFDVFPSEGELRTTLPVAFEARFPALGTTVEDAFVRFRTDVQAVDGEARLFLQHANGTNDLRRPLVPWPPDTGQPTHANVSFEALRGGPALGNVSRLVLKAFKP